MKTYEVSIDLYSIDFIVKAKNKREANKKAREKFKKMNLTRFINKNCSWVEEQ